MWSEPEPEPLPMTVTLPRLAFVAQPFEDDDRAADFAQQRIIRAGVESWQLIKKGESFDAWKAVGKALEIGRTHALRVSNSNRPMGKPYCVAFSEWINRHGFAAMPKSVRSVAIELSENIAAIEHWRTTLSDKEQRRLTHPLSNVRRWRAAMKQQSRPDPAKAAAIAWRRFVACVEALPSDQAQPLWRDAYERAARAAGDSVMMS